MLLIVRKILDGGEHGIVGWCCDAVDPAKRCTGDGAGMNFYKA